MGELSDSWTFDTVIKFGQCWLFRNTLLGIHFVLIAVRKFLSLKAETVDVVRLATVVTCLFNRKWISCGVVNRLGQFGHTLANTRATKWASACTEEFRPYGGCLTW